MMNMAEDIIIYQAEDGRVMLDIKLDGETIWLTQKQHNFVFGQIKY